MRACRSSGEKPDPGRSPAAAPQGIDHDARHRHQNQETEQSTATEAEDRHDEGKAHPTAPIATAVTTAIATTTTAVTPGH